MKKTFSIVVIVAGFMLCLCSCSHKLTTEEAINVVISGEQDRTPLLAQMFDVTSITIDSMRIRIADEPMSGYLYTTWNYTVEYTNYPTIDEMSRGNYSRKEREEREKQIIVAVDNIHQSIERKDEWELDWGDANNIYQSKGREGYIEWESDWESAYEVVLREKLGMYGIVK